MNPLNTVSSALGNQGQAQQQPPVTGALDRLHKALGNLEALAGELESRLVTIVTPEQEKGNPSTALPPSPEPGVSPVVNVIAHGEDRLVMLYGRIDSLLKRLHV